MEMSDDDFITQTIRDVDGYLAGEREVEQKEDEKEMSNE